MIICIIYGTENTAQKKRKYYFQTQDRYINNIFRFLRYLSLILSVYLIYILRMNFYSTP